jgi:hypothetical protein
MLLVGSEVHYELRGWLKGGTDLCYLLQASLLAVKLIGPRPRLTSEKC